MAKLYTKNTWVDEVLADTEKYQVKDDAGTVVYEDADISLSTTVITAGTPVTAARMNNLENGLDGVDTRVDGIDGDVAAIDARVEDLEDLSVPAATANNDFLVGAASGAWVKKTKSETLAILQPNNWIDNKLVRQLWVAGWKPTLTNGCISSAQMELTTNKNVVDYTGFENAATKYGYANVPMPEDYTGGTVYYKAYWMHPTATAYVVRWQLSGVAVGNNETLDVATGTAVAVDDTGGTADNHYISDLSGEVTIGGTPAAGELVQFLVSRAGAHANDTLDVTARLIGVMIWYPVG